MTIDEIITFNPYLAKKTNRYHVSFSIQVADVTYLIVTIIGEYVHDKVNS